MLPESKPIVSVQEIVENHWRKFGRNFFTRYDYEEVDTDSANKVMNQVNQFIKDPASIGKVLGNFKVPHKKKKFCEKKKISGKTLRRFRIHRPHRSFDF
jgi:phosphoglucomutase